MQFDKDGLRARIKAERDARGWSQGALGEAVSVGQNTVSDWETGKTLPNADHLVRICQAFDRSPLWLLTGEGARELRIADVELTVEAVRALVTPPTSKADRQRVAALIEAMRQGLREPGGDTPGSSGGDPQTPKTGHGGGGG